MPKKATQKPAEEKQDSRKNKKATESEAEAEAEVAPAKQTKNAKAAPVAKAAAKPRAPAKKGGKKEEADSSAAESSASAAESSASAAESSATSDSAAPKTRHVPTRDSVEKEFDELVASIDSEIEKLRSSTAKAKGVKFLRTVNKRVKTLRNHALRVSKQRQTTRRNNTNSGFLKPVQISKDLAKFTGWEHSQLRSRVDVTKFICDYIKKNDLQDPADKRNIRVETDPNLKKLLKFDGKDGQKLTYYSLQTYLKGHFSAPPVVATATVLPSAKEETASAKKVKAQ